MPLSIRCRSLGFELAAEMFADPRTVVFGMRRFPCRHTALPRKESGDDEPRDARPRGAVAAPHHAGTLQPVLFMVGQRMPNGVYPAH